MLLLILHKKWSGAVVDLTKKSQGDVVGDAGVATGVWGTNGAGVRSRSGVGGGLTMSGAMTVWTRYQNSLVLTFFSFL